MENKWAFLVELSDSPSSHGEFVKRKQMYAVVQSRDLRGRDTGNVEYHQSVVLNMYFSMFEYRDIPYFHQIGLIHHSNLFYAYHNPCLREIHEFGERKRATVPSLQSLCFYKLSTAEVLHLQNKIRK